MRRPRGQLVRDFIAQSLYHESTGYFSQTDCVLRPAPLEFTSLLGRAAYESQVNHIYREKASHAWLTPVEVFKPWYSRAIANYILSQHLRHNNAQPLKVFEFGGGNGTNADYVLKFLREKNRQVYEKTQYTLVEISPTMAQRQKSLLAAEHSPTVFSVACKDMKSWADRVDEDCFVLGLEVLDNLPHDKLVRRTKERHWKVFSETNQHEWYQTMVRRNVESGGHEEYVVPLQDELATRAAKYFLAAEEEDTNTRDKSLLGRIFSDMTAVERERKNFERPLSGSEDKPIFVASGALQLLDTLFAFFPRHQLILADFDKLPAPNLSFWRLWKSSQVQGRLQGCANAPLVSGEDQDYPSYLDNPGKVDIFFQTDFPRLGEVYESLGREKGVEQAEAQVMRSKDFLKEYGEYHRTQTRTGYNPMLEDYHNTCFFLAGAA